MRPFLIHPTPLDPLPPPARSAANAAAAAARSSTALSLTPALTFTPVFVTPRTTSPPFQQLLSVNKPAPQKASAVAATPPPPSIASPSASSPSEVQLHNASKSIPPPPLGLGSPSTSSARATTSSQTDSLVLSPASASHAAYVPDLYDAAAPPSPGKAEVGSVPPSENSDDVAPEGRKNLVESQGLVLVDDLVPDIAVSSDSTNADKSTASGSLLEPGKLLTLTLEPPLSPNPPHSLPPSISTHAPAFLSFETADSLTSPRSGDTSAPESSPFPSSSSSSVSAPAASKPVENSGGFASLLSSSTSSLSDASSVDNDIAMLIFDIENPSSQLFVISCEIDDTETPTSGLGHQLVSAPSSTQHAILLVKRVWWTDDLIPPLQVSTKQFVRPKKQLTADEERAERLMQAYKKFLTQRVHITWSSTDHTHGRVDLQGLAVTSQHLSKLKRDPITVTFAPNTSCTTTVGSFENVVVTVTNRSNDLLRDLSLHLQLLNESKPHQQSDVSGYLAWVGPLQVSIPVLQPGATFTHKLVVCAFAMGSYSVVATGLLPRVKKEGKAGAVGGDEKTNYTFPSSIAFRITAREL